MKKLFVMALTGLSMTALLPLSAQAAPQNSACEALKGSGYVINASSVNPEEIQNLLNNLGFGTETPSTPVESTTDGTYAQQVVDLVNAERAKAGLSPLTVDNNAASAALVRAKETEISFSHTRPDGRSFSTALTESGAVFSGAGENIAWGQRSPQEVMNGWMNSDGHRANILNPKFKSIGVGHYQNANGTNYWAQLFMY